MTDYSQLVKELRRDARDYPTCPEWQAADAIEALQARVAKLEAERIQLAANCEAIRQELATLRALLERNPS